MAERRIEQLRTLIELTKLITSTLETKEVRRRAIEAATTLLNAEAGSLILIDPDTGDLFFEIATGEKSDVVKKIRLKKGEGIAGWVIENGKAIVLDDVRSDLRFYRGVDEKSNFITKSMIAVPVKTRERMLGVLEVINKKDGRFDNEDLEVLEALSNQIAIAIENANLYEEMRETFYGTIEALAETIEKRDPYTGGHTKRVMDYSLMIGGKLGLSKKEMENLKLSATLHDIGKIGIRDEVLLKKGKLIPEEAMEMNMHPKYGSEILSHIRQLKDVIPGMRGHHEKYDGSGYPDGLKGEEIPLNARIIAIADAFDAMTTDRPYRKALSIDEAINELKRYAGIQFDPYLIDIFIEALKED